MKNLILTLCIFGGGAWWCYAIIDLMFIHTWLGIMGIGLGGAMFLLGVGEISKMEL